MNQSLSADTGAMIPKPALARELGVSTRTISRWLMDTAVEFPKPIMIRGRNYFMRTSVETWKAARLRAIIAPQPHRRPESVAEIGDVSRTDIRARDEAR